MEWKYLRCFSYSTKKIHSKCCDTQKFKILFLAARRTQLHGSSSIQKAQVPHYCRHIIKHGNRQKALGTWMNHFYQKPRKTAAGGSEGVKLSSHGAAGAQFLLSALRSVLGGQTRLKTIQPHTFNADPSRWQQLSHRAASRTPAAPVRVLQRPQCKRLFLIVRWVRPRSFPCEELPAAWK